MGIPADEHRQPRKSNANWTPLCLAVGSVWFAFAADVGMFVIYWGNHPESLHSFNTACFLTVLFGSPTAALFSFISIRESKHQGEVIPRFAWRFCVAAWILLGLVLACIVTRFSYALIREHRG